MKYEVKELAGEVGWKDFFSIPLTIYRNDACWVAPQPTEVRRILNAGKNPYFAHASLKIFICYADGVAVGRSILVVNPKHWEKWKSKTAFFGFFESLNDLEAAQALFHRLEDESRASGADALEGPFNPNHYSELGILLDRFDEPPLFFDTYNPSYYPSLLQQCGFEVSHRLHTTINKDIQRTLTKGICGLKPGKIDKDVSIRTFNIWRLKRDLEIVREINNDAFEDNWPFLPLSKEEYTFSAKYLFLVTSPSMILIAEHQGKPVGVIQFVINLNRQIKSYQGNLKPLDLLTLLLKRRQNKELIAYAGGVKKAYQQTQIAALLMHASTNIIKKYAAYSTTWISEDNKASQQITNAWEMEPNKHFAIYLKKFQP